jgi:chaperone modulatory protein CbpM
MTTTPNGDRIFEARLVDESASLHVDELCTRLRVERQWIVELVELGAIEPRGGSEPSAWAFPQADVPRLHAMTRLVEDLGVNLPGAAIILELVEERRRLLAQLRQWTEA